MEIEPDNQPQLHALKKDKQFYENGMCLLLERNNRVSNKLFAYSFFALPFNHTGRLSKSMSYCGKEEHTEHGN